MASIPMTEIDPAMSILFLGSGFSQSATNIRNEELPNGTQLREEFENLLKVPPNKYDLKTLADEFHSRPNLNLYQTLYELFTVTKLDSQQKEILKLPWLRIYTTNYDDAVEFGQQQSGLTVSSFNYDDPKPKRLPNSSIIHLHGVIRKATAENVLDQLVLNESSYARQHFEKSLWYDEFSRDLRFSNACFFLGYSLSDHHITALLMQNPNVVQKTFFITGEIRDSIFENRIKPYGEVLPIATNGFAKLCSKPSTSRPTHNFHSLKSFRYLDPFKDKRTLAPPTSIEVLNLVTYGTFNFQRCLSTLPSAEYVVPRTKLAETAVTELKTAKCLLVHSRIGNGKTIFCHILAHKLSQNEYRCFVCNDNPPTLLQDIQQLKTLDKLAIFFDSYDNAIELIDRFGDLPETTKFIITVRSGVQDVRLHEIQAKLPSPMKRINLNTLQKEEAEDFKNLLDRSGVLTSTFERTIDKCRDFREVVIALYDNKDIKLKIRKEMKPLLQNAGLKKVLIASQLLKWTGHDTDPSFLFSVTSQDAYAELAKFREVTGDLVKLDDDGFQVRSAMFSEYLIQNHFTSEDIIDAVSSIVLEAVKRKRERRYQAIMGSLLQFSTLKRALHKDPKHVELLIKLFDDLHRDIYINEEPLFWLQYTILMADANDLPAAERFLETAYSRAAASAGFQTYQLDTQALRLLLLLEEQNTNATNVPRFDKITQKLELVLQMIGDQSHRHYAVRVLEGIEPFIRARLISLSTEQKNIIVFQLARVLESLGRLSPEMRAQSGSDQVKESIQRAYQTVVNSGPVTLLKSINPRNID